MGVEVLSCLEKFELSENDPVIKSLLEEFDALATMVNKRAADLGNIDALIESLKENFTENKIKYYEARDRGEALDIVLEIVKGKKVGLYNRFEVKEINIEEDLKNHAELINVTTDTRRAMLYDLEASVTPADLAISETGSLIFFADYTLGTLITIPKIHVVVLGIDRISNGYFETTEYAYLIWNTLLRQSYNISIISNPSRTGDIEKIVVYGAHGPRELHVILLDNGRKEILENESFRHVLARTHLRYLSYAYQNLENCLMRGDLTTSIPDLFLSTIKAKKTGNVEKLTKNKHALMELKNKIISILQDREVLDAIDEFVKELGSLEGE
mgnify:CR=1 FL=1